MISERAKKEIDTYYNSFNTLSHIPDIMDAINVVETVISSKLILAIRDAENKSDTIKYLVVRYPKIIRLIQNIINKEYSNQFPNIEKLLVLA